MNVILIGGELPDEKTYYRYWVAEYEKIRADRAFRRARRAALLRRLGRFLGVGTAKANAASAGTALPSIGGMNELTVSIDSVVGAVAERTGAFGPLPLLKRRWKEIWRRVWAEDDIDTLAALPVVRGSGGWYLAELPRSASVLEVLRAKGVREVRISTVAILSDPVASCVEIEDTGRRQTYRLMECEWSYDCCEEVKGVAV